MKLSRGARKARALLERRVLAGFTLVELMLMLVVVGILVTIGTASYSRQIESARVSKAINDLLIIKASIDRYSIDHNDMVPLSLADVNAANVLDPWGNPYEFLNFSTVHGNGQKRKDHNLVPINTHYDLYSKGADGQSVGPLTASKSRDDIIVANDGAYIGLASNY